MNRHERGEPIRAYVARIREAVKPQPGAKGFGRLVVDVVRTADNEVVGTYERNYSTLYETFAAFRVGDHDFALYSPDYTATRILELPSCHDVGGEEPDPYGFCPVEYYVPVDETGRLRAPYAFVSGCIWGDDSTWKIQMFDLDAVEQGALRRYEKFGYITLPDRVKLADAVQLVPGTSMIDDDWPGPPPKWIAQIAVQRWFDVETGDEILWERNQAKTTRSNDLKLS